jgi:uncharacterized protein (DUF427 family)
MAATGRACGGARAQPSFLHSLNQGVPMSQLIEDRVISRGGGEHTVRLEPCGRRVRAYLGGVPVADSTRVQIMFETGHLPVYYFPVDDVQMDHLQPTDHHTHCPYKGDASYYSVLADGKVSENAAWRYRTPLPGAPQELADLIAFYWGKMDRWLEEDDEVWVHPRDPYHRVDVLNSSRHIQINIGGEIVADSRRPRLLFETGLPTRYYIPKVDVRLDLLEDSSTVTRCPYKGVASYYSAQVGAHVVKDAAWCYPLPVPECPKIENMICFFNERVEVIVDGEAQPRPATQWS